MTATTDGAYIEQLRALLGRVRMGIEAASEAASGWALTWEGRRYPLGAVPLADLDASAEAAELLAVAAAFEAAVKAPGRAIAGETFRTGAAGLLPKLERRRFAEAYDAVVAGRFPGGGGEDERLLWRPFGAELITAYVQDEGWKFSYMVRGRFATWDTTMDAVHAGARSNLYHRAALDWRASEVALGDGYDAARAVLMDDVFYDRAGPEGIELAIPGRDQIFVAAAGQALAPEVVAAAYASAKYPIAPAIFRFKNDAVHRGGPLS